MKILYFTNVPAPYRVKFFNLLNKDNELTVMFDYKKEINRNEKWYSENKYEFKVINLPQIAYFKIKKILENNEFDAVIIGTYASLNGAFLNILLRNMKKKFFINADGGFIDKNDNFFSATLKKMFLSKANYYLSTGKGTNKYLTYYGANKNNIYIYPFSSLNAKDILSEPISYTTKMETRNKAGYGYERLFISVGSFTYRKGYDIFLESLKRIQNKDIGFIIIGGGELKDNYNNYLNLNNIKNVHFIDFCNKDEVFNYYKMSDVFFFPSREDIWGLVINEAMACGLPIISSNNVLASQELLSKSNLYNYTSAEELAVMINKYTSKTKEELMNEGAHNIEKIRNYTIENMTRKHEEIIKEVINKEKGGKL